MTGPPRAAVALFAAALAVPLAGCAGGGAHPSRPPARTPGFTAARLTGGLVDAHDDFGAVSAPLTGSYATLPTAAAAGGVRGAPPKVRFTPAHCRDAVWSGPDAAAYGRAPAAVVTLRRSGDTASGTQLWDELIAAPGGRAAAVGAALGTAPPGCGHVRGAYRGRTLTFTEEPAPGLGVPARAAVVSATGSPETRVIAFAGHGYVGVVYAQGDVSRARADAFAARAYAAARAALG